MTAQPLPNTSDSNDYFTISRQFVAHAREQLEQGDRLQASEKVWGAANYALKAVAIQRGWRHQGQRTIFAIANQLSEELQDPSYSAGLLNARAIHYNFYDNDLDEDDIDRGIESVANYVAELDRVRAAPPRPFTVSNHRDQDRLRRLLGETPAIGAHSERGFVQSA